jgi:hypothetical protein
VNVGKKNIFVKHSVNIYRNIRIIRLKVRCVLKPEPSIPKWIKSIRSRDIQLINGNDENLDVRIANRADSRILLSFLMLLDFQNRQMFRSLRMGWVTVGVWTEINTLIYTCTHSLSVWLGVYRAWVWALYSMHTHPHPSLRSLLDNCSG